MEILNSYKLRSSRHFPLFHISFCIIHYYTAITYVAATLKKEFLKDSLVKRMWTLVGPFEGNTGNGGKRKGVE